MRTSFILCLAFMVLQSSQVPADDWPQWLGPQRDSVWREDGIVSRFPDKGLDVKWRAKVGLGYSGPAVVDGKVFVMDYVRQSGDINNNPGGRSKLKGRERVLCFDAANGKLLWKHEYDRPYNVSYAAGPRCTPTIAGGLVFALGAHGNLWCLDAKTGKVRWSKDFEKNYNAPTPQWGFSAHPLVVDDQVYCVVGGPGSVAVSFDTRTGRERWRSLTANEQGYCPPTMIEHAGTRQLLIWHPEAINGLDPDTGDVYWTVPLKPSYGMSVTVPRQIGGYLFASGIGNVGALLKLDDDKPGASIEWRGNPKNAVYSCNSTPVVVDGVIYGNDCGSGALMGVRADTGKRLWQTYEPTSGGTRRASHGTAFIVRHQERFFLFSETGDLILANLSPEGYHEISRFHVLEPTNECFGRDVVWSHPAFAQKCVFARNDKELVCVSLAGE